MEAAAQQPGDWVCGGGGAGGPAAGCGNINFARRAHCNRCGRRRAPPPTGAPPGGGGVEIGKCAADKSRGLFSADDWQCAKCANVNWARRLTCNVCNAPKFGEVEARTGYGGGYNERGVVEYRPRRDSDDDEYDEFGRVKKRRGKESTPSNKVCGNWRHPRSPSDDSAASPSLPPRLTQRPGPKSSDIVDAAATERPRKRSSTCELDADRPRSKNNEIDSKFRHFHRKFDETGRRDRVGVTPARISLRERVLLAAWAISHQSCKTSAFKYQASFDKTAPDFKLIYEWKNRLLNTGCLAEAHFNIDRSSREASDGRTRRKRKRRYFRSVSTNYNSSDDEIDRLRRPRRSDTRDYISFNCDRNSYVFGVESRKKPNVDSESVLVISDDELYANKKCDDKSDDSNSDDKIYEGNYTNGSVGRSSTSGAKHSMVEESRRSEGYLTENARSETPEITIVRSELAQLATPVPVMSLETEFQEDNYFDEPPIKNTGVEPFLIPEVPKQSKTQDTTKEIYEDIVSENEKYSSDGSFNTDVDVIYSNGRKKKSKKPDRSFTNFNELNESNLNRLSAEKNSADPPSPKRTPTKTSPIISADIEPSVEKNFSSAMKRIIRSMSNQSEDAETENLEYIPTKIDPAMAKRNHILFKSTALNEAITDLWTQSSNGSANASLNCENKNAELQNTNKSNLEDYLTDEDALYRDNKESDDQSDEEVLKTPPRAPDIGSIRQKSNSPNNIQNISSLLNFNFNNINTEDLALALKSIQSLPLIAKTNGVASKSPNKSVTEVTPSKKDNIPFLEDMFSPDSPSKDDGTKINGKNDCQDLIDDLDVSQSKKVSSPMTRFKSFAIPKPIMLNRLRGMLQTKGDSTEEPHSEKIVTRRRKKKNKASEDNNGHKDDESANRLYGNNEDEDESEDEDGDLSKYDLWGSDEEKDKKKPDKDKPDSEKKERDISNKPDNSQRKERSKSPGFENTKRRSSDRSGSASSRRSTSSSSSSSSGNPPRNRYDDFILNSEHSKTGSRESSSARSRSPVYDRGRDRDKRRSRSREKTKDRLRENRDRDRDRDRSGKSREAIKPKGRGRDRDRDRDRDRKRHHHSGTHSNHVYTRGRAR